jgi:class 3 adenylate cyclase/tetratricopeptide (TPR) repeat protein
VAYTPKHLAERILTSKAALEGERKQVTVLFADLKGSMELLADRDPEEARKLLDPVLEQMMQAVHRYEGTVNQVMGDGIMALFGAPVAHEDHAVRACYAALDVQRAMRRLSEDLRRAHGVTVQVRVGLNSGEVVVRAIGSDLRMDYSAVGPTTHLAARMEQLAHPGTILLTPDTLRLAEGSVVVTPLGPVPVKGLAGPLEVYELTGAGPLRSRFSVAAARGLSRFVGRDRELEVLRDALGRAADGHGQLVAVVGEPGVGKSRFVWEVTHSHRTHGWRVLESGSVSYGKATSYLPVIDLLKAYFGIQDRGGPREVREKVTGKVLTLDRALEPSLPALLALLDVPVEEGEWVALDPARRRQLTLDAVKRLVLRESQVQAVLLVFEDLHWIDTETQALLDALVDSLPTARLLLLVNYRPEYTHRWGSKSYYTQLRLDPLPTESAQELLDALLGSDPELIPLKALLIARTEGNPFFLEEGVRALVETGALAGERGAYRLTTTLPSVQVPATVQAVLAARIDRLPTPAKRLLQSAAVIGKDVPLALLEAVADEPEGDLRRDLAQLQAAELLYETSLFPDIEYTFKHALTHEVAYASLLQDRRRGLHARIADAMERLYRDRLAEVIDRLGHHAYRSERWADALRYLLQAGGKALSRAALREAVSCFEQALTALERLPPAPERLDQGIDLRLNLRNALYTLGEHERALEHLRVAERLATERGDPRRLARALGYTSTQYHFIGVFDRGLDYARRAVAAARTLDDPDLQMEMDLRLAVGLPVASGDYRQAADGLRRIVSAVADDGAPLRPFGITDMLVIAHGLLAAYLAELGEFVEAVSAGERALRRAERVDPRHSLTAACAWVGQVHLRQGNLDQAIPVLERGLERCRTLGSALILPWLTSRLGLAYARAGRPEEARPLVAAAVDANVVNFEQSLYLRFLAEAHLLAGRHDDAAREAERALELSRQRGERPAEAWVLWLLGEIAAQGERVDAERGRASYGEALTLAEAFGMRPLAAHCHLGLGKVFRRMGEGEEAREHLTTAMTLYREMDIRFWLEPAEAELKELG